MKKILISLIAFVLVVFPHISFSQQERIRLIASSISSDGLYAITVYISNPHPKSLKLKAEYGEGKFDLKSNTFTFDDRGRGTAALTGLRPNKTYQYRLFDTTGVLSPSDSYSFTTSGGAGGGGYQSYYVASYSYTAAYGEPYTTGSTTGTSSGPTQTTPGEGLSTNSGSIQKTPGEALPATPPAGSSAGSAPLTSNTIVLGSTSTSGATPSSTSAATSSTSSSTTNANSEGLVTCGKTGQPECNFKDIMYMINKIIHFILFTLALPVMAIMFFYAGFLMVTSGGSPESKSKAKSIFSSTLIGFLYIAGAWLIIRTLLTILGYDGAWIFGNF